jgi:drug/metabolite transporter (DMT)-like permease
VCALAVLEEVTMTLANFALLAVYALGMSFGQVLFKLAADRAKSDSAGFLVGLLGTAYFYVSVALYAVLAVVWIWVLTRLPLSRAYPFAVLAFVFTPLLAALFFGEPLGVRFFASLALIVAGLALLASERAP